MTGWVCEFCYETEPSAILEAARQEAERRYGGPAPYSDELYGAQLAFEAGAAWAGQESAAKYEALVKAARP